MSKTRTHSIAMAVVEAAFEDVKENRGAPGVDKETITEFEKNAEDNLYKIWNRMSSGSYFPPVVHIGVCGWMAPGVGICLDIRKSTQNSKNRSNVGGISTSVKSCPHP